MELIDFEEIKRQLSVHAVLTRMGWRPHHQEPTAWRGDCPVEPTGKRSERCCAVTHSGWWCHKCKRGGDVIRLVQELHQVDAVNAALWLCETFALEVPRLPARIGTEKRNGSKR